MTCAKMAIPTPPLGDLTYKSQKKSNEVSLSPRSLEYGDRTGQVRVPEKVKGILLNICIIWSFNIIMANAICFEQ